MNKTRSLIGKTLLTTLILMLLSIPFMTKASAYTNTLALPAASVYMDPFRIQGNAGDTVQVYLRASNVEVSQPLFSFQAGLKFDPNVVNCSAVVDGGFLSSNGGTPLSLAGTIDNNAGIITPYGYFLTDTTKAANGSGALIRFTFNLEVTGYSDVHVTDFIPITNDGSTEIPMNIIDYFTAVVNSNPYVVKIVGNPIGIGAGTPTGFSAHKVTQVNIPIGPDIYKGELNFTITASGAGGDPFAFFNVTMPKSMMSCSDPNKWLVSLNGAVEAGRVISENTTHTTASLQFTYGSAPIAVRILSIDIVPEFSSVFFASLLVLATFAAALFGKTTWSHKRKS